MTEETIFARALELPEGEARRRFLEEACGGDAELRRSVEELLATERKLGLLDKPLAPTADVEPATTGAEALLAGKYRLREPIGEGGMGSVFLAEQTTPVRRLVAVKVIKAGMDSKAVLARFDYERRALEQMDHPNIARVLDAGQTADGRPFFAMELVKGVPITKFCDERQLSPRERLELFIPVCQAIQHAHQRGIIHRDVKPSNVLVALYDDRPMPKVIDFGVAKATGGGPSEASYYTRFGAVVGTPEYMSPEQAQLNELDIDTRSDVYALGVLLYELLTGTTPFAGRKLAEGAVLEMLRIIREEDPEAPSRRLSTTEAIASIAAVRRTEPSKLPALVRGELDWIVLKCLEKNRARRYDSAIQLAQDLQRYLADEPVAAGPPSAWYRFRKFARRHRMSLALAGAVVIGVLTAFVGMYLGLRKAQFAQAAERDARHDAETQKSKAVDAYKDAIQARFKAIESLKATRAEKAAKEEALERSEGLRLAAEAESALARDPALALNLALAGVERHRHPLTFTALYRAAAEQRQIKSLDTVGLGGAGVVRWSPDGERLFSGGAENWGQHGCAAIWDAHDWKRLAVLRGFRLQLADAAWSPDGQRIATCSEGYVQLKFTDGRPPASAYVTDAVAHVWDSATGRLRLQLVGHQDSIKSIAYSPDGQWILTASLDRTAKIWEAATGKLKHTLAGHERSLRFAKFSPDGAKVLTLSADMSMESHGKKFVGHGPAISVDDAGRKFELDTHALGWTGGSIGSREGKFCRMWDAKTGKELFALAAPGGGLFEPASARPAATAANFSADGRFVAVGFADGSLRVYEPTVSAALSRHVPSDLGKIKRIAAGPKSHRFFGVAGENGAKLMAYLPNPPTQTLGFVPVSNGQATNAVHWNADGRFATVGDSGVKLWNSTQLEATYYGHAGPILDAQPNPNGKRLATGGADNQLRIWNLDAPPPISESLGDELVSCMAASPDGRRMAYGHTDGRLLVKTVGGAGSEWREDKSPYPVQSLRFASDGETLFVCYGASREGKATESRADVANLRGAIERRSASDGKLLKRYRLTGVSLNDEPVLVNIVETYFGAGDAAISPTGDRLVLLGDGRTVDQERKRPSDGLFGFLKITVSGGMTHSHIRRQMLFDAETGKVVAPLRDGVRGATRPDFSRDGSLLALIDGGEFRVVAAKTGQPDPTSGWSKIKPNFRMGSAFFLPHDAGVVGVDSFSDFFAVWNPAGELVESVKLKGAFNGVVRHPDGRQMLLLLGRVPELVALSTEMPAPTAATGVVMQSRALLRQRAFVGHESDAMAAAFSPDGKWLITGSKDNTALVWEVATGKLTAQLRGHAKPVTYVGFLADGRAATAVAGEPVRIWPADVVAAFKSRASRPFTYAERERYSLPEKSP